MCSPIKFNYQEGMRGGSGGGAWGNNTWDRWLGNNFATNKEAFSFFVFLLLLVFKGINVSTGPFAAFFFHFLRVKEGMGIQGGVKLVYS